MDSERPSDRLVAAHAAVDALRSRVEAGAPWPPSAQFGTEPEANWNPPELLAHLAEMVPYWMAQIERILAGHPDPVSFGRVQSDEDRIAAIGRDRSLPVGELFDRIAIAVGAASERLAALSPAELARRGTHPTLGQMTVAAVVERMLIGHVGDHARQLERILAEAGANPP